MSTPPPLPPDIANALRSGNLLEAIKLLRKSRGVGLAEAKQLIEAHMRASTLGSTAPGHAPKVAHKLEMPRRPANLSPGEVPRSSAGPGAIILVIAAAVVAFLWLQ